MDSISVFGLQLPVSLILPLAFLLWVTILFFLKKITYSAIHGFASKTKSNLDDILIRSLNLPLTLLILASGAAVVEKLVPVTTELQLTNYFFIAFKIIAIIAGIIFFDKFFNAVLYEYSGKVEVLKSTGSIVRGIVRLLVISLGLLILLDSMGISITPIIASLGIGSLAVALALQPTLENLFAGIQMAVDKPVQVGHFIKLESGEEGYVHKIGWRSTWVRLLANNIIVIPNKVIVNSKILNYYYPETEMSTLVQVGVHYESDLEHVERVTVEVAKEALQEVQGGVKGFDPFIRYHTFADFSINFSVILRVAEFVDNYLLKHVFIKKLHKRYAEEGIVIPYPIRAINYDQEKAFEKKTTDNRP